MTKITEQKRVMAHLTRARMSGTIASLSLADWERTVADFHGLCAYCLASPFETLEHFLPVEIAGTHVNNCVPACLVCNRKKRDHQGDALIERFGRETIERVQNYLVSRQSLPQYSQPEQVVSPKKRVYQSPCTGQIEDKPEPSREKTPGYGVRFRVEELAWQRRLRLSELSRLSGIKQAALRKYWNNEIHCLSFDTCSKIAAALGVRLTDLIDDTDTIPPSHQ